MKSPSAPVIAATIVIALLGYVLSIGPASRMVYRSVISERAFAITYAPVVAVARRCQSARRCLVNYCAFWTGKPFYYFSSDLLPVDSFNGQPIRADKTARGEPAW
jgi:hypothetical protein